LEKLYEPIDKGWVKRHSYDSIPNDDILFLFCSLVVQTGITPFVAGAVAKV
jgi:hypothetical protein